MVHIDERFLALLEPFSLDELDVHNGIIYGLWRDGRLAYFNRAWTRFAAENGGGADFETRWRIGADTSPVCAAALAPFYRDLFDRCHHESVPQVHVYECSSRRLFRRFHMTVYPIGDERGVLIVNSMVTERATPTEPGQFVSPRQDRFLDRNGLLHQCCHCRRFQTSGTDQSWDWVPTWVDRPPDNTSHGLCAVCFEYHYRRRTFTGAT